MDNTMSDLLFWILVILFAALMGLGLLINVCLYINSFAKELDYINMEIRRTDDDEREYWISQRRHLWLSLIPFVRY